MKRSACAVFLLFILAACGDDQQEGVTLKAPQGAVPTASPAAVDSASETSALSGRLLYLKGRQFQVLDLQSGETTAFDTITANSSPAMNADQTRGVFVAFPNFGLIDLSNGTSTTVPNTGTNPFGADISPDGRWMITLTGGIYRVQMKLIALDDSSEPVNIATGSNAFYRWAWTPDSRLAWWDINAPDTITILDPTSGESAPAGETALATYPFAAVSPDGTRLAAISPFDLLDPDTLLFNLPADDGTTAPDHPTAVCADSVVSLYPLPLALNGPTPAPQPIWTEPNSTASSPEWVDDDTLLFVKVGSGSCGQIEGEPLRQILILDVDEGTEARPVAGPIGNQDDRNDEEQGGGLLFGHLFDASPDGRYVAWIAGDYASGETLINVTNLETGETQMVVRFTVEDALGGKPDYLENYLIRGVLWLE